MQLLLQELYAIWWRKLIHLKHVTHYVIRKIIITALFEAKPILLTTKCLCCYIARMIQTHWIFYYRTLKEVHKFHTKIGLYKSYAEPFRHPNIVALQLLFVSSCFTRVGGTEEELPWLTHKYMHLNILTNLFLYCAPFSPFG